MFVAQDFEQTFTSRKVGASIVDSCPDVIVSLGKAPNLRLPPWGQASALQAALWSSELSGVREAK